MKGERLKQPEMSLGQKLWQLHWLYVMLSLIHI